MSIVRQCEWSVYDPGWEADKNAIRDTEADGLGQTKELGIEIWNVRDTSG